MSSDIITLVDIKIALVTMNFQVAVFLILLAHAVYEKDNVVCEEERLD